MPDLWFPGAERIGRPSNNAMSHSSSVERVTLHTSQGATGHGAAKATLQYTLGRGIEYSMAYDVASDEVVQCHPWTDGARALLNAGLPGGGANRNGKINFQLMVTGDTAHMDEMIRHGMSKKLRRIFEWAHEHGIPLIAPNHGDSRDQHKWMTESGWYSHGNTPGQDHTDGRNDWSFLKDLGGHEKVTTAHQHHPQQKQEPADGQRFVVLVKTKKGWRPVGKDDKTGQLKPILNADNWTVDDTPHIRVAKADAQERVAYAKDHGHEYRIMRAEAFRDQFIQTGELTLAPGQKWPKRDLVDRLRKVADEIGKPLRIVSGWRPTGHPGDLAAGNRGTQYYLWEGFQQHKPGFALAARPGTSRHESGLAADVDVVQSDGSLVSIGVNPEHRKIMAKHGLCLPVGPSNPELWHCEVGNTWRACPKP